MCVCARMQERQRRPRERITKAMLRHSDWHHVQTERGGTEKERKRKLKRNEGETERDRDREREKGGSSGNP